MKKIVTLTVFALCILCISYSAFAAESEKTVPDAQVKPAPVVDTTVNITKKEGVGVVVEHFGDDEVGGTLALKLKENFRKSVLFQLADKTKKSIRIKIVSQSEFTERPEIGSIYTAIWTFAGSEDVVPFYLDQMIGTVNFKNIETTAAKLMNTTDKIAEEYKYLFE